MKNDTAVKMQVIAEILGRGFLCRCSDWATILKDDGTYEERLFHKDDCEGKAEAVRLLRIVAKRHAK